MAIEYTLSINELLKDKVPELPGVVRSVAVREFRLAMREFFEKSYAWTADIKKVAVPTGETRIQLDDGDSNTEVIGAMRVAFGNSTKGFVLLHPVPDRPVSEETTSTAPKFWYVSSNPDEITLYPYLDTATTGTLTAKVALMPSFDIGAEQNALPRQITLKYYDTIMDGFLARMYAHPNKPYSAPATASQLRSKFLQTLGFYIAQRKSGYNGSQNWTFPSSWKVAKSRN